MRANAAPGYLPRRRRRGWRRTAHILGGSSSGTALCRPPIRARPAQPEARAVFVGGKRHQMAWRLGKVLYWLSCIGAVFVAGTGVAIYVAAGAKNDGLILMGVLLVLAALPWAIGKAFLYIFSAR